MRAHKLEKTITFLVLTFLLFISPQQLLISKCNSYFRTTQGNLLKSFRF